MTIRLLMLAAVFPGMGPTTALADTVVPGKSEIAFTMKQMGVNFDGRFKAWKADIVFKPAALDQSKATIDIDLASLDLASADSEAEARDPLWFNTSKFPVAHFASTSFKSLGGDRYEVSGKLALKGITRDCVVPIAVKADAAQISANQVCAFEVRLAHVRAGQPRAEEVGQR